MENKEIITWQQVLALISINMIYACVGICSKSASQQEMMSLSYVVWLALAVAIMGVYAVLWQQVLRYVEISTAYMFKGCSLIFTMLIAAMVFREQITIPNIIGSAIIIIGIILLAKS